MDEKQLVIFSIAYGTIGLSSVFLPPVAQVAATSQSDGEKQVVHETMLIAGAHILIVAGLTSYMAKSMFPFWLALAIAGSLTLTYEYALRREAT